MIDIIQKLSKIIHKKIWPKEELRAITFWKKPYF